MLRPVTFVYILLISNNVGLFTSSLDKYKGTLSKLVISKLKHLLWMLKRTVSLGHLFSTQNKYMD